MSYTCKKCGITLSSAMLSHNCNGEWEHPEWKPNFAKKLKDKTKPQWKNKYFFPQTFKNIIGMHKILEDKTKPEEWITDYDILASSLGMDGEQMDEVRNFIRSLKKQWTDEARQEELDRIIEWAVGNKQLTDTSTTYQYAVSYDSLISFLKS